ncbi:MAG: hypothetical protein ACQEV7_16380 [Bacillota bacterium]
MVADSCYGGQAETVGGAGVRAESGRGLFGRLVLIANMKTEGNRMKLNKGEKHTLKSPLVVRNSFSVGTIPAGVEIEIQQVNADYRQYLVDNVWMYYKTVENAVE